MEDYKWTSEDMASLERDLRLMRFAGESADTVRMKNLIMDLHRRLTVAEKRISELKNELSERAARDELC